MASSARVKAKNKPSLKSQGAGYSTTNRKGETTYYKSSKDAAGYNDTRDGKNAPTTPGTPLSRVNAMGASIPAKMTPETPASIPSPYTLPDIGNVVGQNNTALSSVLGDTGTTYDATKGQFVTSPTTTAPTDNFQSLFQQATQMGNAAFDEMGTSEQRLAQLEKENKLKQKQQAVNETTGQINAVVAQSQAQQLALEGQGRGQTGAFIGGEQARINREAAIAALPLQAKLAAEQGALDLAQSHIDKMFQVQSQDALAKYQYKSKLIESVYSFATGQEQRRLDAIKAKEDRTYDEQKTNLAYQRSLASEAASYGLGGVSASILKLDPKSPTFNQDIAGLQSRVMKPVAPVDTTPKVVSVNGVDSVWNPTTKQFEAITVGGDSGLKTIKDAEIKDLSETWTAKNSVLSLVDSLQKNIKENGTQNLFGKTSGERTGDTTNLLLAMKNLEKTGALDAGTIKVLEGTIPSSKFFATEAAQIASLQSIKDTIESKVNEYVGSYRGTSAETDPRTKRIYGATTFDNSLFQPNEVDEIYNMFGVSNSTSSGAFNADQWLQ